MWCSTFTGVCSVTSTVLGPKWAFKEQLFKKWLWCKVLLVKPDCRLSLPLGAPLSYHAPLISSLLTSPGELLALTLLWADLTEICAFTSLPVVEMDLPAIKAFLTQSNCGDYPTPHEFSGRGSYAIKSSLTLCSLIACWGRARKKVLASCFQIWGSSTVSGCLGVRTISKFIVRAPYPKKLTLPSPGPLLFKGLPKPKAST